MSKFPQPINEYVIILPDETVKEEAKGGFEIPDALQEKPKSGTVKASSKGYYAKETGIFIPLTVKEGDRVKYLPFAGANFPFEGTDYLMIKESDITCIL